MKPTSGTTRKTKRHRVPPLPTGLRRVAREIFTVQDARRIIMAHGGRLATKDEIRELAAAGLAGLPRD